MQGSGKNDEALSLLYSGIDTFPDSLPLRLRLALLQQSEGEQDKAKANYEKLLDSMPKNTIVLNNLAWLYHESGDQRAVPMAQKAYELSPDNAAIVDTYGWIINLTQRKLRYTSQRHTALLAGMMMQNEFWKNLVTGADGSGFNNAVSLVGINSAADAWTLG